MSVAAEFMDGASGRGWKRDPVEVVRDLRDDPSDMAALVIEAIHAGSRRALAGLPWVADDDLDDVSTAAFTVLAGDPDDRLAREIADRVVAQQRQGPPALHLAFPLGFRPHGRGLHPTNFPLEGEGTQSLGGTSDGTCPICGDHRHPVLSLDPVPEGLGISLARIDLETCLSCVGWATDLLYQVHDSQGAVAEIAMPAHCNASETFAVAPLKPTRIALVDYGPRWRRQAYSADQNLNKVGGSPTWVREAAIPPCDRCGQPMIFVLQIDSGMPDQVGSTFVWGSGGLGYAFWCDDCLRSAWRWQAP